MEKGKKEKVSSFLAHSHQKVGSCWWTFKMPSGKTFQAGRLGTRVTLPGVGGKLMQFLEYSGASAEDVER